jgi:ribosomal protein S18 acetylase RimI-like enzyme
MKENPETKVEPAIAQDVPQLAALFDAYRVFYEATSAPAESETFVRRLVDEGKTRFFVARYTGATPPGNPVLGFVHLMPSISTVAMRPIWLLEDLYVAPDFRQRGIAATLMRHAESFARQTGAERLTLATAHNNRRAQSLYQALGYVREDHFWYYHRMLE